MTSIDILVKFLTSPGVFWPLVMTNIAVFCAGGYTTLSLKFIWMHRGVVTQEIFDRHLREFHIIEAKVELNDQKAEANIEEVRRELSNEIEKVSNEVARRIDTMRLEIREDMKERFEILNDKSDTIHRSLNDFKNLISGKLLQK